MLCKAPWNALGNATCNARCNALWQAMDTGDHDVAFLASFADPSLIFEQLAVRYIVRYIVVGSG